MVQITDSEFNPRIVDAETIIINKNLKTNIGRIENVQKITLHPNSKMVIEHTNTILENNTLNEAHEYNVNNDEYVLSGVIPYAPEMA